MSSRRLRSEAGAPRGPVLLVCEQCEHRLAKEGRFRQITQLRQALDSAVAEAQASASGLRILPVSCLDVCPRGAMAVARGAERGRGPAEIFIVRTPDEFREICHAMVSDAAGGDVGAEQASVADESKSSSTTMQVL